MPVTGPLGRGAAPQDADAVLLCVPDAEIAAAAALVPARHRRSGHCSGATGLDVLAGHEAFSLHPLMTVTAEPTGAAFAGAGAAVAGTARRCWTLARGLASRLGMRADRDRPRRSDRLPRRGVDRVQLPGHAGGRRRAAGGHRAGMERADLLPLVRATVENWARLGPERALTGPVARGDEDTVARQRAGRSPSASPELLALFDALVDATRALAASGALI